MEPPSQNEQQPKPSRDGEGGAKIHFTGTKSSPGLDSVVVKTQILFISRGGFLTYAMQHHRETILSN